MLIFSATLHWLISQAIFLSKIEFQDLNGGPSERFGGSGYGNMYGANPGKMLAAGYSSLGILLSLCLGAAAVVVLLVVGWVRLRGDMVLAGSCSAAIAAACQNNGKRENVGGGEPFWMRKLGWGEVVSGTETGNGVGRLGFSSRAVRSPREGVEYL